MMAGEIEPEVVQGASRRPRASCRRSRQVKAATVSARVIRTTISEWPAAGAARACTPRRSRISRPDRFRTDAAIEEEFRHRSGDPSRRAVYGDRARPGSAYGLRSWQGIRSVIGGSISETRPAWNELLHLLADRAAGGSAGGDGGGWTCRCRRPGHRGLDLVLAAEAARQDLVVHAPTGIRCVAVSWIVMRDRLLRPVPILARADGVAKAGR